MPDVTVRPIRGGDEDEVLRMALALWPDHGLDEAGSEIAAYVAGTPPAVRDAAMYVAERSEGGLCGFIEVGLRDVAEGCWRHSPVGYVEGWFVDEDVRRRGIGGALIAKAEEWARDKGCWDIGSDALLENTLSQTAHDALGFREVERSVHYAKPLV